MNRRTMLFGTAGAAVAGGASSCGLFTPDQPQPRGATADQFSGEVPLAWSRRYIELVRDNGLPPPATAQMLAEFGIVLHAAGVAGSVDGRPMSELGSGALRKLSIPDLGRDQHWPSVANAALLWLMPRRFEDSAGPTLAAMYADGEKYANRQSPRIRDRANDAGTKLGQAIYDWYLKVMLPADQKPIPCLNKNGPGSWKQTPPTFDQPVLPRWGRTSTMVIRDGAAVQPGGPPAYSERPNSDFYLGAKAVYDAVKNGTDEHRAIARHWSDGKWTINPAGHWLLIAAKALEDLKSNYRDAAETVMMIGFSQHDAFISCWWTKYHFNTVRPITYIREVMGERKWEPPVTTPCFPEYTSGHATQSAAAARVLRKAIGDRAFTDDTNRDYPARSFDSYTEASKEAAISRLYGGIHYPYSNNEGLVVGDKIGAEIAELPLRA